MSNPFFEQPILNSPYGPPNRHWELDEQGQPTQRIVDARRRAEFITPIPKPRKRSSAQQALVLDEGAGLSTREQQYELTASINRLREHLEHWRRIPNSRDWGVSPETARLLQHWRSHQFSGPRPFFCQLEAVEAAIWLTEVAPGAGKPGSDFLQRLKQTNAEHNRDLPRSCLKLATGAGKTTVMAMLIAWQTLNAVRRPQSSRFSRGFLVVTPGITIRDRLRVLLPNDPTYYLNRELVPADMIEELKRAKVVITNYHGFKHRERVELSKGGRSLLQGRGQPLNTLETDGQMLQRAMSELTGLKNIVVLNDEAHHCYREKSGDEAEDGDLKGDEKKEAEQNNEAARLWFKGLEVVQAERGISRVVDLSATPFFLRGSGYAENTIFPWTVSDFSLMDAIECGIVKLPRVPVADNIPGEEVPMYRNLWEHIGKKMPKKGRGKGEPLDPFSLPVQLLTALDALYGHYEKTFELWQREGIGVPPCFIVVCNNTASSKLVYDYISGFQRRKHDGSSTLEHGRLRLFRNFDENTGEPLPRPVTLLIDSQQLESGEGLDDNFRAVAADEIAQFRRELIERTKDAHAGENLSDQDLLREVMNTVGRSGRLGAGIRCVVSVSMLTEGWDANTVTHILGLRAFGTQLLCEQVIGRALRRQSYELNAQGLFDVEYADVLGIPFDFTASPVTAPPQKPRETIHVKTMPDREGLEIKFPRVVGYRVELPAERLAAAFSDESVLRLTPDLVGATRTQNAGIIGERVDLNLAHTGEARPSQVVYELTKHLVMTKFREPDGAPQLHLFGQLKRIAREWLDNYLVCEGDTFPAQLQYKVLADMAAAKIMSAITKRFLDEKPILAELDPYNPVGSTAHVSFTTSKLTRWEPDPRRCQLNWIIVDSDWEAEFCRVVEEHPRVRAYVKNHNLGFEVPYRYGSEIRAYRPDFIVHVEDGHGENDLLNLVVEIKGYRGEDAKEKKATMDAYWVPGVNQLRAHGRWAFTELRSVYQIEADFTAKVKVEVERMLGTVVASAPRGEASA